MDEEQKRFLIVQSAIAAVATALFVLAIVTESPAHDAPSGWSYDVACCSGMDCREVGDAHAENGAIRVFERREGYVISTTSEVIPMTSPKVRPSPDGRFHWCSVGGSDVGRTICLYVPPRGF